MYSLSLRQPIPGDGPVELVFIPFNIITLNKLIASNRTLVGSATHTLSCEGRVLDSSLNVFYGVIEGFKRMKVD